eukprot:14384004-Alexandrium_andersonii.AAC.1
MRRCRACDFRPTRGELLLNGKWTSVHSRPYQRRARRHMCEARAWTQQEAAAMRFGHDPLHLLLPSRAGNKSMSDRRQARWEHTRQALLGRPWPGMCRLVQFP